MLRMIGPAMLVGLVLAAGAALLFAWLAEEVPEGDTGVFDEGVRSFVHQYASTALTSVMRALSLLGSSIFLVALGVCVGIAFIYAGWRRGLLLLALTMAGAIALEVILKYSFQRTRPTPFFDTPLPNSYSFPSGHALFSFCFYGALAAIITNRMRRRASRLIVWTLAALLVVMIGISRVYLGVHHPSDVVAGYAVALVWVVAVAFGDRLLSERKSKT
jgi:membrane-associated phospholipid phosphatase